jgi:CubicO group peptidase (beta-lactamase class C family)
MNTIQRALADTKCAATSAVRAASKGKVRQLLTSMILLLLVLEPAISQAGLAKARQPLPPAPSLTPTLPPASEEVWPTNGWPTATPAEMGMNETKLKQARDFAVSQGGGSGFITRGGKLVLSWGSSSQRYALKSTTKSIGVTALGLAIKDGVMNLSDQAQQHHASIGVPPNSNSATGWLDDITLLHLATHTAGFDKPGGYTALLFQPGTEWYYSDGGPNWLAEAITLKYQQDLNAVMFDRVFSPLGIDSSDLRWRGNLNRPDTIDDIKRREFGSGISASVDAMARIGYLYLRKGQWEGQEIIPQSFVEEVSRPVSSVQGLPLHEADLWPGAQNHYGLLWWNNADGTLAHVPGDAFWSWGLFESIILVIPSLDVVVSRAGTEGWQNGFAADYEVLEPFFTPIAESVTR